MPKNDLVHETSNPMSPLVKRKPLAYRHERLVRVETGEVFEDLIVTEKGSVYTKDDLTKDGRPNLNKRPAGEYVGIARYEWNYHWHYGVNYAPVDAKKEEAARDKIVQIAELRVQLRKLQEELEQEEDALGKIYWPKGSKDIRFE